MTKKTEKNKKVWVRPQLARLGKIADVAGNAVVNNNGASPNLRS
jgi:hypothetical protein